MKTLLIYPEKAENARSWSHKLGLHLRREHSAPLELVEISIELPITWERALVDLNVAKLPTKHLREADCVIIRADFGQEDSVKKVIRHCQNFGKTIVGIGPLFRVIGAGFECIHHFVLSETELPRFICDLENGVARPVYGLEYIQKLRRDCAVESSLVGFSGNLMRGLQLVS